MFCYQCEQTMNGTGCTQGGVCGKNPETAALQDLLVHAVKGVAQYARRAAGLGAHDRAIDVFVIESLFTTVTNVNFDPATIQERIAGAVKVRQQAKALYEKAAAAANAKIERPTGPAEYVFATDRAGLLKQAPEVGVESRKKQFGDDAAGLIELITYGLKGTAAYADHALILGQEDRALFDFFHETLDFLTQDGFTADELLGKSLEVGKLNIRAMELLDKGNTDAYGHPEPTQVRITPVAGKAILVTGHDLKDLKALLEQTEGKGINIYTHGEMLPAHAYPELKKHKHLVGNFGSAWQLQRKEFVDFPGAILFTTNCIQKPHPDYEARVFTTGLVEWPGCRHVTHNDFSPVIAAALAAKGFTEDGPDKKILVGFGRNAVMNAAGKVIELVKAGKIRHFFLIGGCDGAKPGRNYYTDFAKQVPDDCVILTLACGKYRFNKLDFGAIDGIPRLLDVGQCNDAYSAVKIALALAEAFGTDVNGLPLSLVLSWYEQKAVCILLSLLYLGIKGMRLGPSLPAFLSPNVVNVLVEKFDLKPIGAPEEDLAAILG